MNYWINHLAPSRVSAIVQWEIARARHRCLHSRVPSVRGNMENFLLPVTEIFILFLGPAVFEF